MPEGLKGYCEKDERLVLHLAKDHIMTYHHPYQFAVGLVYIKIAPDSLGDFLAKVATVMKVDVPGAAHNRQSRYQEYSELAQEVYEGQCRDAQRRALFEIFQLRAVNQDDPEQMNRYQYPEFTPF